MKRIQKSLYYPVRFLFILVTLPSLGGCMGSLIDTASWHWFTSPVETYPEMTANHTALKEGNTRVFIYRTDSSKNPTLCTVDDTAYEIIWEIYRYVDVAQGKHIITCGSDVIKSRDHWTSDYNFQNYQRASSQISLAVESAAEIFVRVDETGKKPSYFQPTLVSSEQAHQEILKLRYQKIGGHTYFDGKIVR